MFPTCTALAPIVVAISCVDDANVPVTSPVKATSLILSCKSSNISPTTAIRTVAPSSCVGSVGEYLPSTSLVTVCILVPETAVTNTTSLFVVLSGLITK